MFDPLSGILIWLLTGGIKKLGDWLVDHGFNLEIEGWASAFVSAFVSALIGFLNYQAGNLPDSVEKWIPFLVQILLLWLQSMGWHGLWKQTQVGK